MDMAENLLQSKKEEADYLIPILMRYGLHDGSNKKANKRKSDGKLDSEQPKRKALLTEPKRKTLMPEPVEPKINEDNNVICILEDNGWGPMFDESQQITEVLDTEIEILNDREASELPDKQGFEYLSQVIEIV